jgi:hypothetical protein
LIRGNYVFAFMPSAPKAQLSSLDPTQYRLLILPAELVQVDSLQVHDAYWSARGGDTGYSVMVKVDVPGSGVSPQVRGEARRV